MGLPFHTAHGVFSARILEWFAIPSSRDHVLSELSSAIRPSWVVLYGVSHSFIELGKSLRRNKAVTPL